MFEKPKAESAEDQTAREFEADANVEDAWTDDPAPIQRGTLGTQVTVRLDSRLAGRLRSIARRRGIGYTSLLRSWVEDRIRTEERIQTMPEMPKQRFEAAITYTRSASDFDVNDSGRRLKELIPS